LIFFRDPLSSSLSITPLKGGSYEREVAGEEAYRLTLDQLKIDYQASVKLLGPIDILYAHIPGSVKTEDAMLCLTSEEIWQYLEKLLESSQVSAIGASISSPDVLKASLFSDSGARPRWLDKSSALQVPARLLQQQPELIHAAQRFGLSIVLNSPIRHGLGDSTSPTERLKSLSADPRVSHVLTGTRHHLDATVGAVYL
jgi:aryl-alcohol dehydrogenase-like predicted oxidoreductase